MGVITVAVLAKMFYFLNVFAALFTGAAFIDLLKHKK